MTTNNQGVTPEHLRNLGNLPTPTNNQNSPDKPRNVDPIEQILDDFYDGDYRKGLPKALAVINKTIMEECQKVAKAYGGCTKCYGKGYATVADGTIGYDDFGGEGFKTPITTKMKFCTCDRGKQLKQLTKKYGRADNASNKS